MSTGLRFALYLLLSAAALLLAACASAPSPTLPLPPSPSPSPPPSPTPSPTATPTPAVLTAARLADLPAAGEPVRCAGVDEADPAPGALCRAAARGAPPALPLVTLSLASQPGGALAGAKPAGLSLRPGMALSLVGWLRGGEGEDWVVAAVREERGGEAVVFLAAVAAGELREVLAAHGYAVEREGEGYRVRGPGLGVEGVALPQIPADDPLYPQLQEAMGAVFFDKAVGPDGEETFLTNPIVPHPPAELVPDETAVSFQKDEKTATVTAVDASGKPLAQAKYDWEKKVWEWEKAEERLQLVPASLSLEQARNFIAAGELLTPQEIAERFANRVYALNLKAIAGGVTTAFSEPESKGSSKNTVNLLLSQEALAYLPENNIDLSESNWLRIVFEAVKDSDLKKIFDPKGNYLPILGKIG